MPNTILQQTSSPDITTVSNTLYNRTSWTTQHALSADHLPIITTINIRMTTDYNKTDRLSPSTRNLTGHNSRKTQSPLSLRPSYPTIYTLPSYIFTSIILMADKHNLPKGKMYSNYRLLPAKSHKETT